MTKHLIAAAALLAVTAATASAQTTVMPLGGGFYTYGGSAGSGTIAPLGGGAYSVMPMQTTPYVAPPVVPNYGTYGVPNIGYRPR